MSLVIASLWTLAALAAGAYAVAVLDRLIVRRAGLGLAVVGPLAAASMLLRQEDLTPERPDRFLYLSAPYIAITTVALAALVIPLSGDLVGFNPSVGLFYLMILIDPFVIALMDAGWGEKSPVGTLAAFRAAGQLIAYIVPLGFAATGPIMAAETMSLVGIVEAQDDLWYAVWQPLGLAIYLLAALIASYRRPFDLPQADELGGGALAEYSGVRLLLFRAALDALFLLLMAWGVVLFFDGWQGPWLPGPVWFALKTLALSAAMLWVGRLFPRIRHDQLLEFAWKILVPASLVNFLWVGLFILFVPETIL